VYIITSLLKSALVQRVSGVIGHKNITSTMAHKLYHLDKEGTKILLKNSVEKIVDWINLYSSYK